ncbi:MAG: glycosyl transferase [Subtercola sp.]|nr:glycosyl transferase [Subtercola sp.]
MSRPDVTAGVAALQPTLPGITENATVLGARVRSGLVWSAMNNVVLRLGGLALGILLARILTPQQFGVYAVALSVQAIVATLADFGLSADLIRSKDFAARAPTVASLGLAVGAVLMTTMLLGSATLASSLGSPDSAPILAILSITLLLGGAGAVPFAALQRRFDQRRLFVIAVVDFAVSTTVTLVLLALGWGVLSLAIGRVVAQLCTLVLQYALSGVRPRFGFDRSLAASVLRFGLPVAGANVLSWAVLGSDKIVIALLTDPISLGYYVLAFNISTWPMTALGQVVRSVALPAFARRNSRQGLVRAFAVTWALALPLGGLLAVLAVPVIQVLYGQKWAPAAAALVGLGILGSIRVVFDLFASYLLALGHSGRVMVIQAVWFAALLLTLVPAVTWWGYQGAAWAHVAVSLVIVMPAYLIALRAAGCSLAALARAAWPPLAAAVPAAAAAMVAAQAISNDWLALATGSAAALAIYGALLYRWMRSNLVALSASHDDVIDDLTHRDEPTHDELATSTSTSTSTSTLTQHGVDHD